MNRRYVHKNNLKRAQVTAGDVVFAISGTKDNLGTVSIIPEHIAEANLNSALVILKLDWSVINKKYFCYMFDLNITRLQIDFIGKGTAQNNLNNDEISEIRIFLPNISERLKIVEFLDKSHVFKKQKEEQAQKLLESIDDYLLGELGIDLPEPEENTIQNRIFLRNFSEVSGARLDCNFYVTFFNNIEKIINTLTFQSIPLGNI
ncbi:MAG: restriction endonuclease subunit S [Cyanobacteriota bacterium]